MALPALAALCVLSLSASERHLKVRQRYLNIPISQKVDCHSLRIVAGGDTLSVAARITGGEPDYWVFKDMTAYRGRKVTLLWDGPDGALERVVPADSIFGAAQMYHEKNRPQFHFSTRRGWINDPNGLIYHDGLYHIYYQHNPYEREWGNMTWGHATSTDLLHWQEHDDVLHPDRLGTMFSGSAVCDSLNTSGFGTKMNPPLVYAYTADNAQGEVQCIAYSLDGGMTLHKYEANPVIGLSTTWNPRYTRDPRLFRYGGRDGHWVMVLNEGNGHSIYTSDNLREWTYRSHVPGLFECPELFPLAVDGDPGRILWVMYGASGTYMLGHFDGFTYTPVSGKHRYVTGTIYAAQTFTDAPDGRRIQLGWSRIGHFDMPFHGIMLLPTELSLRTTASGPRLVSQPVAEVRSLLHPLYSHQATAPRQEVNGEIERVPAGDCFHLSATMHLAYSTSAGIDLDGQRIVDYDCNQNTLNGQFYAAQDPTSLDLALDIYVDRTTVEVFVDGGLYSYSMERHPRDGRRGIHFWGDDTRVSGVQLDRIDSVWR